MVRAKFLVESKTKTQGYDSKIGNPAPCYSIVARPVYSGSKENEEYFQATPSGCLELNVLNKAAADQFEPGDEIYITFEKAN